MGKDTVQRPRHLGEIERIDQQGRVSDLPATAASHEAPELFLMGPSLPRRLLLEGAERLELTLGVDDPLHGGCTEGTDQVVLLVCDAHVGTESFDVGACASRGGAGSLARAPGVALIRGVN